MLVLGRYEGESVTITHTSGDVITVRVNRIHSNRQPHNATVSLAFDDAPRNFQIERPERKHTQAPPLGSPEPGSIDRQYYRGTLVDPGFDEFSKR